MPSRFGSTWNAEIQRKRRRMIPPPLLLSPDHLLVVHVLVLFMLLVLVAPGPVGALIAFLEPVVVDIGIVTLFVPAPVSRVLAVIPVVIILVIGIVYAAFAPLFLLVPLVIVLWCGHSKGTHWRHQRSRQKQRSDILVSTLHSYPPSPTRMMLGAPRLETNRCRCTSDFEFLDGPALAHELNFSKTALIPSA